MAPNILYTFAGLTALSGMGYLALENREEISEKVESAFRSTSKLCEVSFTVPASCSDCKPQIHEMYASEGFLETLLKENKVQDLKVKSCK
ncbi:hypothetical protein HZA98_03640 [Candidatus Woesearchaeota archaeon]|nr:hypothetical protein [Candidatus Woesearchaeota archaeon]